MMLCSMFFRLEKLSITATTYLEEKNDGYGHLNGESNREHCMKTAYKQFGLKHNSVSMWEGGCNFK